MNVDVATRAALDLYFIAASKLSGPRFLPPGQQGGKDTFMKKIALLLLIVFALVSCDVDKELDKAFASNGLARINAPRADYSPGAIILKGKKLTIPAGNISDYVKKASMTVIDQNRTDDVSAILPKLKITKNINPTLASDLIASSIPINGSVNLKFTSNVDIDQISCKVSSIKIADLKNFLRDPNNAPLAHSLSDFDKEGAKIYIAYEVWKASSIKIRSSTGTNIDTEAKVGEVKPLLKSGDAKFSYSKTADKSLEISGDQFYPFALRLAKVTINPEGALDVTFTDFKLNIDVKAIADESYSALPNQDGQALSLSPVNKGKIVAALRAD